MIMTYNDIFFRNRIVANIPLVFEGRKLPKSETASVMLIRVAYNNKVQEFEKDMEEVLKGLKKEGFDDRAHAIAEMESVDARMKAAKEWKKGQKGEDGKPVEKPEMPSDEELKKADETRATKEEFEAEKKELEEEYVTARQKRAEQKVEVKNGMFSRSEYAEICEVIGYEGEIEVSGFADVPVKIPREEFLGMIAAHLVQ
jgi:hypothetical protein|nr:MAG TPA: hypothetical protein [Caudoviricetes sp.]